MQNHLERQKEWADNFFIKQKKIALNFEWIYPDMVQKIWNFDNFY